MHVLPLLDCEWCSFPSLSAPPLVRNHRRHGHRGRPSPRIRSWPRPPKRHARGRGHVSVARTKTPPRARHIGETGLQAIPACPRHTPGNSAIESFPGPERSNLSENPADLVLSLSTPDPVKSNDCTWGVAGTRNGLETRSRARVPCARRRRTVSYQDNVVTFKGRIEAGEKIEAGDWMPDEYRQAALKFIEMHANSEVMGALPEREWIPRAPTLRRKLSLTAKVQDEVGHGQILYRVAEDLGKSREQMFDDLVNGRTKFHNVFHYPTETWGDVAVIGWLIDGAALVTQKALLDSSYLPYVRAMR